MQGISFRFRHFTQEAENSFIIIASTAGLIFFLSHLFGINDCFDKPWLGWLLSYGIGGALGVLYFFFLSWVCSIIFPDNAGSALTRISTLHVPLCFLALYPLDLRFSVFEIHFPPLNESFSYIMVIFIVVSIFRALLNDSKIKYVKALIKYIFLSLLGLLLLRLFDNEIFFSIINFEPHLGLIDDINNTINIYVVCAIGLATICLHRRELEISEGIESSRIDHLKSNKRLFYSNHPRISKIPILRRLLRFLYGEGWLVSAILLVLIICGGFNIFHRLEYNDFINDEFHMVAAAKGYVESGSYREWRWNKSREWNLNTKNRVKIYTRAWPHTLLIASSFWAFGVSEWSARLPSALIGILFYVFLYFISKYFWKNRWSALLTVGVLIFSPNSINFFRLTRMYAPLIFLTLIVFYLLFKFLDEPNKLDLKIPWINSFVKSFFNFNLVAVVLFVPLFFFSFIIHINVAILLPFVFVFSIWLLVSERKLQHLFLVLLGVVSVCCVYILSQYTDIFGNLGRHTTYFGKNNTKYFDFFFGFPGGYHFTFLMTALGLGFVFIDARQRRRRVLAAFFVIAAVSLVFFCYFANRLAYSRYVCHIVVLFIMFVVGVFGSVAALYPMVLRWLLVFGLTIPIAVDLYTNKDKWYSNTRRYGRFSKACEVLKKEIKPKKQVVFAIRPKIYGYYYKGIHPETKFISIHTKKKQKLGPFVQRLYKHREGWIIWPHYKQFHLRKDVVRYIKKSFKRKSPRGSKASLYYYNRKMIKNLVQDSMSKSIRYAKLSEGKIEHGFSGEFDTGLKYSLRKPISLATWIMSKKTTPGAPFDLGKYRRNGISIESRNNQSAGGFRFRYEGRGKKSTISTGRINDKKWHHMVFYQDGGKKGDRYGLFIDGERTSTKTVPKTRKAKVKIRVLNFKGKMEDLRIYNFALSQEQVHQIYNKGKGTLDTKLKVDESEFAPIQHWKTMDKENLIKR